MFTQPPTGDPTGYPWPSGCPRKLLEAEAPSLVNLLEGCTRRRSLKGVYKVIIVYKCMF
jgi:hypothetical protein